MPIYEYRCTSCGFEHEYLQKITEPPLATCPACAQPTFTKLISAAGFQLKGSGWYVTDFKESKSKSSNKKDESKADNNESAKPSATGDATGKTENAASAEAKSSDSSGSNSVSKDASTSGS